jgi:DNA polymerase-3 subunit gamma/tau
MEGNIPAVMLTFDEILANGFDGHNFINGFSKHTRDLMVCKDASTLQLLEVSETVRDKYRSQSEKAPATYLLNVLDVLNTCDVQYKSARNQRLHVELALLKLCALRMTQDKSTPAAPQFTTPEPVQVQPVKAATANTLHVPSTTTPSTPPVVKNPEPQKINPAPRASTGTSRISTVSINSIQTTSDKKEIEKEIEEKIISGRKEFDQEEFTTAWTDFAKRSKNEGKMSLQSILLKNIPEINMDKIINLNVDNEVMEDEINQHKAELMSFLREKLNNGSIQLNITVVKDNSENSGKAYTTAEKFKKMAEKNPAINDLKKQFDLEIGI